MGFEKPIIFQIFVWTLQGFDKFIESLVAESFAL